MKNEIDHEVTDGLVCPYCGHEDTDSWELDESAEGSQCESCAKFFSYTSFSTRTFTSKKVPCLNGESPHVWKSLKLHDYHDAVVCTFCQRRDYRITIGPNRKSEK